MHSESSGTETRLAAWRLVKWFKRGVKRQRVGMYECNIM
jgi:hypothetical protein